MRQPSAQGLTAVLVVDHGFVSGGQSKVAFDSALGLKRAGHEPIVFAAVGPIAPELQAGGIRVICLDQADLLGNSSTLSAAVQGIWNGPAEKALGKLLATLPQDRTVVHVHSWAKALSPSIGRAIRASALPAITTFHEYSLLCPNGGFYNYRHQHQCPLQPLSASCWATNCDSRGYSRKLWRNVRNTVMEKVARLPDLFSDIICISEFQYGAVGSMLPAGARVHLLSNPIATVDLGPKPDPASGQVAFIGRISPEKGPLVYAEAMRQVGLTPVFVGAGPARVEVEARFPEATFIGWQDHEAVRGHLRRARALVFSSRWYEGQPLTVLEALSMGTPVIVSDGCAGRDAVADGVSGLWFKNGDVDDLARAVRTIGDDAVVSRLSEGAYTSFWSDPPTLERHVRGLLDIYGSLVASPVGWMGEMPGERAA